MFGPKSCSISISNRDSGNHKYEFSAVQSAFVLIASDIYVDTLRSTSNREVRSRKSLGLPY